MSIFLQGIIVGFAYIAPIGMQNIYIINSALEHTRKRAITVALIIALFDMSLAVASFYGMGKLLQEFKWLNMIVLLVGSLVVIYIGYTLLRENNSSDPEEKTTEADDFSYFKVARDGFTLAWLNPQAIIDGTMLLGAFRVSISATQNPNFFILGVCLASITWFIVLTLIINALSTKFKPKYLLILNKVCGIIIIGYGLKLIWNFIQMVMK